MRTFSGLKLAAYAITASCTLTASALAIPTCKSQADAKNLHGAAQTSFIGKCERDAKAKCDSAKAKGLHGAATTSYSAKCARDATGS